MNVLLCMVMDVVINGYECAIMHGYEYIEHGYECVGRYGCVCYAFVNNVLLRLCVSVMLLKVISLHINIGSSVFMFNSAVLCIFNIALFCMVMSVLI